MTLFWVGVLAIDYKYFFILLKIYEIKVEEGFMFNYLIFINRKKKYFCF